MMARGAVQPTRPRHTDNCCRPPPRKPRRHQVQVRKRQAGVTGHPCCAASRRCTGRYAGRLRADSLPRQHVRPFRASRHAFFVTRPSPAEFWESGHAQRLEYRRPNHTCLASHSQYPRPSGGGMINMVKIMPCRDTQTMGKKAGHGSGAGVKEGRRAGM